MRVPAVAVLLVGVAITAAACRASAPANGGLVPDPAVTAAIAAQKARQERQDAARKLTAKDAERLETALAKNPDDLATRELLLIFYGRGPRPASADAAARQQAHRTHVLWLIAHHPDSELLERHRINGASDPAGAEEGRRLWLSAIEKPGAPAAVIGNAADYFQGSDQVLAAQLFERARALQPDGPGGSSLPAPLARQSWTYRLARLYGETIGHAEAAAQPVQGGPTDAARRRSANAPAVRELDAAAVRQQLDASTDEALLVYVARWLMVDPYGRGTPLEAAGRRYAERALQVRPRSARARQLLMPSQHALLMKVVTFQRSTPEAAQYDAVRKMPERDRFEWLPELAERDYMAAEARNYTDRDALQAISRWQRSRQYAQDLLNLLPRFKDDPNSGTAFYRAYIALGLNALREGDGRLAAKYLLEASRAPRTDELAYGYTPSGLEWRLVNYLLKSGERTTVAMFLERTAAIRDIEKDQRLADAAAIRKGMMPVMFQWGIANGHL